MPRLSIDIGASTIDLVRWCDRCGCKCGIAKGCDVNYEIWHSFEYGGVFDIDLKNFLKEKGIDLSEFSKVSVTGGKSALIDDSLFNVVGEIDAIGKGGQCLMGDSCDDFVVISMGTGTCLVHSKDGVYKHLGGTGVGGGTFLALSRELFGIIDIDEIRALYEKGSKDRVDLSVKEVVGSGIGVVSGDVTASNLGKIARDVDFSKEDLAAGVVNLIGQTIATAACFAAKSVRAKKLVLTGKLTRIEAIVDVIRRAGDVYEIEICLPKNADFVSAIGAGV